MAKKKVFAVKFGAVDKGTVKGKVGHTRTGACTARGARAGKGLATTRTRLWPDTRMGNFRSERCY